MTFSKPAWQHGIVPYGLTPAEFTSRGVPNVSAVASSTDPGGVDRHHQSGGSPDIGELIACF